MTKTSACRARGQIIVPYNGLIATLTHADTNKHTLDLPTAATAIAPLLGETRKIIAINLGNLRTVGVGSLFYYPNEGTNNLNLGWVGFFTGYVVINDGTQRFQYALENANETFALYCFGYVVES